MARQHLATQPADARSLLRLVSAVVRFNGSLPVANGGSDATADLG